MNWDFYHHNLNNEETRNPTRKGERKRNNEAKEIRIGGIIGRTREKIRDMTFQ